MDRFLPFRLLCLLALACSSSALAPPQAPQRYARNHILHAVGQPDQASFGSVVSASAVTPTTPVCGVIETVGAAKSARPIGRRPARFASAGQLLSAASLQRTQGKDAPVVQANGKPPMVCDRCGSPMCQCFL